MLFSNRVLKMQTETLQIWIFLPILCCNAVELPSSDTRNKGT